MKKEEFLNASGRRFRNQSGGGSAQQYYDAGVEMAYLAWEDGGVTALLEFLAGYNAATYNVG